MSNIETTTNAPAEQGSLARNQLRVLVERVRQLQNQDVVKDYKDTMIGSYEIQQASERLGVFANYKEELGEFRQELEAWQKLLAKSGNSPENDQRAANVEKAITYTDEAIAQPGPVLGTVESTAKFSSLIALPYAAGQVLTPYLGGAGTVVGVLGGYAGSVIVDKALKNVIPAGKARTIAKTAVYGGTALAVGALVPGAWIPLLIGGGIAGATKLIGSALGDRR